MNEILNRISQLTPNAKPLWGKMTVSQMLAHCSMPMQAMLGERKMPQTFFEKLFGKIAKKRMVSPEPFKRNLPTNPRFV
ncbi:MAG: hypothetical protein ABJA79_05190 [Parafilimonas sp.]